jgi:hypothetical protein
MSVPEAPVDHYDGSLFGQGEVGPSAKSLFVKSKLEPGRVERLANSQFRSAVAAPDSSQHNGPSPSFDDVHRDHKTPGNHRRID